jgi:hypothetical protein
MPLLLVPPARSPARVHTRALMTSRLTAAWIRLTYRGGLYLRDHYRTCSWCGCIHPFDLIELLDAGKSRLRHIRPGKIVLLTPNPIAGELVAMGSVPGPVFPKDRQPADLSSKFLLASIPGVNPTRTELLNEHYDRPCHVPAPDLIEQPLYAEHTTDSQWAAIEAVAEGA